MFPLECAIQDSDRIQCGSSSASAAECASEETVSGQGCCWVPPQDPSSGAPQCFFRKDDKPKGE